jgi:hypothetical protein
MRLILTTGAKRQLIVASFDTSSFRAPRWEGQAVWQYRYRRLALIILLSPQKLLPTACINIKQHYRT